MNTRAQNWPSRALWFMLAVSAVFAIYLAASKFGSCRADGYGQVSCFIFALFSAFFGVLEFAVGTVVKILTAILP